MALARTLRTGLIGQFHGSSQPIVNSTAVLSSTDWRLLYLVGDNGMGENCIALTIGNRGDCGGGDRANGGRQKANPRVATMHEPELQGFAHS